MTARDRQLTADMAHELRAHDVAVVSLYPGLVRTEKVMKASDYLDMTNSESPQFIGRVIEALAHGPAILTKSGQILVVASEAAQDDITDIDGTQPTPLTLAQAEDTLRIHVQDRQVDQRGRMRPRPVSRFVTRGHSPSRTHPSWSSFLGSGNQR